MRIRSSVKVTLVTLGTVALGYAAWWGYNTWSLRNFVLTEITPGEVNLVAIDPGSGFRIIVANEVAQLAEIAGGGFDAPESDMMEIVSPRKLPIRETLQSLQGDERALGRLIMQLNDMGEDIPPVYVVWTAEDIRRALDGDQELQNRLVQDIQINLDGTPLDTIDRRAFEMGIVLDLPVPVNVRVGAENKLLVGRVREPFQPSFVRSVLTRLEEEFEVTNEQFLGVFLEEVRALETGTQRRENVRDSLEARISEQRARDLAERPNRVLSNAEVVVNQQHLTGAKVEQVVGVNQAVRYNITVGLTNEGRMRLWKYSREYPGFQLLFIVNDVAVAAPRIQTALNQRSVTITQLSHERMVRSAVDAINQSNQEPRG